MEHNFFGLKETSASTLPAFTKVLRRMDDLQFPDSCQCYADGDAFFDIDVSNDLDDENLQTAGYVVSRVKSHIAVQLLIIQVATQLYKAHQQFLSVSNIKILVDLLSLIASHAHQLNTETILQKKLQTACSLLELSDPPLVHFENESYQNYLRFLEDLLVNNPSLSEELNIESQLAAVCEKVLQIYLKCTQSQPAIQWILPLSLAKKEELAARTSLLWSALQVLSDLDNNSFREYVRQFFPLLVDLVRS